MTTRSAPRRSAALLLGLLVIAASAVTAGQAPVRPKLVLLVSIDQFRYDYLIRFRGEYTGGLRRLLDHGAVFTNAYLEHYPTVTAIGHATMLSGAIPSISGIIGNDWYDRETKKVVTSVSDDGARPLGSATVGGASPRRLLVSTVGDELKRVRTGAKVVGISLKDRSAILPVGRGADAAYWYDTTTGAFVSSTYYFPALPEWVTSFNAAGHVNAYAGKIWLEPTAAGPGRRVPEVPGQVLNTQIYASPFGNDLLTQFAEALVTAEQLGQRGVTDLLTVSFSSNDAIGHAFGPDSAEVHAISVAVDRTLGRLLEFLDRTLGEGNVLMALTSDHGVAPTPEALAARKETGGRIRTNFFVPIDAALDAKFGNADWIEATAGSSPYFSHDAISRRNADPVEVRRVAADAALAMPHVARVYTRDQLLRQRGPADPIDARVMRGFNPKLSGDLEIILNPFWIRGSTVATHGTPYNYDAHIPLILMGPGIKPGRHDHHVALNDLAPTLSSLLDIEPPSGSVGRVLTEAIARQEPVGTTGAQRR